MPLTEKILWEIAKEIVKSQIKKGFKFINRDWTIPKKLDSRLSYKKHLNLLS